MRSLKFNRLFLSLFAILSLTSFSTSAFAARTCVKSVSEFQANKAQFPQVFQRLPLTIVTDGMMAKAALKIRAAGDKIKFEGSVWAVNDLYKDDTYVKEICYTGQKFDVTLENGKKYSASSSGSNVVIKGQTFKPSSPAKFASIVNDIQKQIDSKGGAVAKKGSQ